MEILILMAFPIFHSGLNCISQTFTGKPQFKHSVTPMISYFTIAIGKLHRKYIIKKLSPQQAAKLTNNKWGQKAVENNFYSKLQKRDHSKII